MNFKEKGLYNLKIHYIWTFFSSLLFLAPIITLYYKYFGLTIHDIVILSATFTLISTILEIPTSTIGDTIGRVKVMKMSVLSSLFSMFLIFAFPNIIVFYVAVFFSALGQALWSGTGHAKLQEDLEASSMQNQFGKVIGRLIALENIGKLFTPVGIYFILKYFENGYRILAFLDVIFYSIGVFFVFKFIEIGRVDKYSSLKEFYTKQIETLKTGFHFFFSNKSLLILLFIMILGNDLGYLAKVILPSLVENGVKDFLSSYVIWFSVLAGIIGNLTVQKIADKIGYKKLFLVLILLNSILHFIGYYFSDNNLILSICFIFISFTIGFYGPTWNHLVMKKTDIQQKATVRSIFLMVIGLFEALFLFIFSFFSLKIVLLILSFFMFLAFLVGVLTFN